MREAGDNEGAIERLLKHGGQVDDALGKSVSTTTHALEKLRATLALLQKPTVEVH